MKFCFKAALAALLLVGLTPRANADEPAGKNWRQRASTVSGTSAGGMACLWSGDLGGSPRRVRFRTRGRKCPIVLDAPHRAVIVRWSDRKNRKVFAQALLYENGAVRSIWKTALFGPGFSTINDIRLGPQKTNGLLDIVLSQTLIPRPGDTPFRPGPPRTTHFKYDGTRYRP